MIQKDACLAGHKPKILLRQDISTSRGLRVNRHNTSSSILHTLTGYSLVVYKISACSTHDRTEGTALALASLHENRAGDRHTRLPVPWTFQLHCFNPKLKHLLDVLVSSKNCFPYPTRQDKRFLIQVAAADYIQYSSIRLTSTMDLHWWCQGRFALVHSYDVDWDTGSIRITSAKLRHSFATLNPTNIGLKMGKVLANPGCFTVSEDLLNVADPQAGLGQGWARLFSAVPSAFKFNTWISLRANCWV